MGFTLEEIAEVLGGELTGDPGANVDCVCPAEAQVANGICVIWDKTIAAGVTDGRAGAYVILPGIELPGENAIRVSDPRSALVDLLELLHPRSRPQGGIEKGAVVSAEARCAEGVYVAAGAYIEAGAVLSSGVEVHANAYIGHGVLIDRDSIIHPNATLCSGTRIGQRVIIHSGAVIGSDGYGYLPTREGERRKIPQVGIVVIEDDVEVGAGTTIDRATLGRTVIRSGTKIDNQVQIAHNCDIGHNCCLVAQVGIAGTSKIGDRTVVGGQAGILDHVTVGSDVRVAAQAGVLEDAIDGDWMGSPAMPGPRYRRVAALWARLPEINEEVRTLRRKIKTLEEENATLREAQES